MRSWQHDSCRIRLDSFDLSIFRLVLLLGTLDHRNPSFGSFGGFLVEMFHWQVTWIFHLDLSFGSSTFRLNFWLGSRIEHTTATRCFANLWPHSAITRCQTRLSITNRLLVAFHCGQESCHRIIYGRRTPRQFGWYIGWYRVYTITVYSDIRTMPSPLNVICFSQTNLFSFRLEHICLRLHLADFKLTPLTSGD